MAWRELEFCRVRIDLPAADADFLDEAYFALNFFRPAIKAFFAELSSDGGPLLRHLDGRIKPRVKVRDLRRGYAVGWADGIGSGHISIDRPFFETCRDVFTGALAHYVDPSSGATRPLSWGDRYWALLEVAAVLLHETCHVAWRLERRAWCLEGFFRHRVQAELGIAALALCGQTDWPCGACADGQSGCTVDDLQGQMIDFGNWPGLVP